MKTYETIIIFKPKFDKEIVNRIDKILQDFTGDDYFITKHELGVRTLAYEVKKYKQRSLYNILLAGYRRKR